MKFFYLSILFIVVFSFFGTSQELVYELDFEDQTVGTEITKRNTLRFQGWNKSEWTVGQEEENKLATSTTQAKVFLIKSFDVTPGNRYSWTLKTRSTSSSQAWKRNINLSVTCGTGDDVLKLATIVVSEPKSGKWIENKLDFMVPANQTKVSLQLFRFAEGTKVSIDNYKLVKI